MLYNVIVIIAILRTAVVFDALNAWRPNHEVTPVQEHSKSAALWVSFSFSFNVNLPHIILDVSPKCPSNLLWAGDKFIQLQITSCSSTAGIVYELICEP